MLVNTQPVNYQLRQHPPKLLDIASEGYNLPNQAAAGQGVMVAGHNENGFNAPNRSIRQGELEFISQIGDIADAAEDGGGIALFDKIDRQAGISLDADAGHFFQQDTDHRDPLGKRKELALFRVDADGHDELVKELYAPADDVQVPVGDRIKLAWENGDFLAWHWTCYHSCENQKSEMTAISIIWLDSEFWFLVSGFRLRFYFRAAPSYLPLVLHRRSGSNGVVYYASAILEAIGVRHAFSTRIGGISSSPFDSLNLGNPNGCEIQDDYDRIWANYALLLSSIGCPTEPPLRVHQVHGKDVLEIQNGKSFDTGCKADALVSGDSTRTISIRTADCVPILLSSDDGRVVAAVHAGWRGIVAEIIPAAAKRLTTITGKPASTYRAAIGPCIGFEAFEVGAEVLAEFQRAFGSEAPVKSLPGGKGRVDLRAAARMQLLNCGFDEKHVDSTDRCTVTHQDEFFSHRRDHGITGRMAAIIAPNDSEHA